MPIKNSRIDLRKQERLDAELGEHVQHFSVKRCSCSFKGDQGRAYPNCRVCNGTGRVYGKGRRIRGVLSQMVFNDRSLFQAGFLTLSDMIFTPSIKHRVLIRDYDMIRLLEPQPHDSGDVLVRGQDDQLDYIPGRIIAIESHDPLTGVRSVWDKKDITITDLRTITWATGTGPQIGQAYTVVYDAIFDWIVFPQATMHRIIRHEALGQRVVLKKRHLFAMIESQIPA